jgi:hypothetical protein
VHSSLQVGVFVVEPGQGTIEQLAYATLVCVCFAMLHVNAAPFRLYSDDLLSMACSLLLSMFFIVCVFYKHVQLAP